MEMEGGEGVFLWEPHESLGDIPPALEVDLHLPFSIWVELIQQMEDVRDNPIREIYHIGGIWSVYNLN